VRTFFTRRQFAARAFVPFLAGLLPDHALRFASPDEGLPQVAVAASDPGAGYQRQRVIRPFVPVTNWRLPLHAVAPDELAGIFAGRLTDWSQLGSPISGAIERLDFTPAAPPAIPGVATPIAPVAACADYEALVAGLDAYPNGIALVPLDVVDFRVQTLALDERNLDPLAGRGDLAAYPLRRELWLNWEPRLGSALRDAANTFALQQGYLPDGGPAPAPVVNLTVAGDIIFGRTVHRRMVEYGDFAHPLREVAPRLAAADLTIADLECSLSDRTEKPESPTTFFFTTNAAAVDGLTLAGIDGVSLANNHSMNFGALGLTDTLAVLEGAGITPFGGGLDLAASRRPGLFEVKGTTIAWLGYDGISAAEYGAGPDWPGTCPLDADLVVEDIAAAKAAGADLVIPFFHWSEEYVAVPSAFMREMAHLAIDSGAGLVVGSHPHWVQGTEWYKGVPILYSLGNFVFDQEWSLETKQGMFAEIVLRGGRPVRLRLVPVLIEDYNRPRILSLAEGLPILERVYEATDSIRDLG
jgi:poly-gamma-glutamate synthesis protein (capsule biosynthesis protein)